MQLKSIIRRLMVALAIGWLVALGTQPTARSVMGQQFPSVSDRGFNGSYSKPTNANPHSEQPSGVHHKVSNIPAGEHGFRQANERRVKTGNATSFTEQQPAVISSSYHRAVISNAETYGSATQSAETHNSETHKSALSDTVLVNASLNNSSPNKVPHSSPNKVPQDSASKLTPLPGPNPAAKEARAQGSGTLQMFLSVGSSLMVVIGLFMGSIWLYRKSLGSSKSGGLPKNVVQILGRAPVAARQQLVLLRFGSKLVLVSMVQGETRTISEITDPLEVDRLAGLCEGSQPGSISSSFREILFQGVRT